MKVRLEEENQNFIFTFFVVLNFPFFEFGARISFRIFIFCVDEKAPE
jgi:hypothetical protein